MRAGERLRVEGLVLNPKERLLRGVADAGAFIVMWFVC